MKRPNRFGTVYRKDGKTRSPKDKDGNPIRRRNPWVAVVHLGYDDETGRRIRKSIGSFPGKTEALQALDAYNGNPIKGARTFADITFDDVWQAVAAERRRRGEKISQSMRSYYANHLGRLHDMKMEDIKTLHLQRCIDDARLAPSSLRHLVSVYRCIYEYAIANDLTDKDYSQYVSLPKASQSKKHHPFTAKGLRTLWAHSEDPRVKMVLILVYTGMRRGELSSILLENVDLKKRIMVGGSKTAAGRNRQIPIAQCILPFVKHFATVARFAQSKTLLTAGMDGFNVNRGEIRVDLTFNAVTEELGLTGHTSHDARHTFVTLATNWGVPDMIIKRIVGHAVTNDVTKDVYTHSTADQYVDAVDSLPWGEKMTIAPETPGSLLGATGQESR